MTDEFEKRVSQHDNGTFGCWTQTRRESQKFHITLGVLYGNSTAVIDVVNQINNQIKW